MPVQDNTPEHSQGFGPAEHADDTRQAQHDRTNDSPVDVNVNAVYARSQVLTVDLAGKTWAGNNDRREKMWDQLGYESGKKP